MKEVYDLYDKCLNWLNGDETCSSKEIIEEAVDVLADIPELDSIWEKCMVHVSNSAKDEEIIEELSDCLGLYIG